MRIPVSWLAEFVDVPAGTTIDEVHAALVSVGLEEEGSHHFDIDGPVVVGEVLEFGEEPQTNGKTIRWCSVRVAAPGLAAADGGADVRGIVCGAGNFFVGDKVVVTLPGAVLPGNFAIAARKTYGHVSDGMIASARELGLGDEHDGILRLVTLGLDPAVGADALALLGLTDAAVEVNVTPDRGYAFSIRGIAREYAHATGAAFRDPALALPLGLDAGEPADGVTVSIDDRAPIRGRVGATVFVTRVVRQVDPTVPTPAWMVSRLKLAGIRSISIVVDVTNYVMLELGQPLHGYDLDALQGGIVVRRAQPGETLKTLDAQMRTLDTEDLVIADDSGAIGLAGVMGGFSTEISGETTAVLIEAANFDPVTIARTARRHKLPSEASKRFERGVDPQVAVAAAARAVQLLEELAGGRADGSGSGHHEHDALAPIFLPDRYISELVGVDYTDEEVTSSLIEIGAWLEHASNGLLVSPPSWRPDLTHKSTLAEEVARIVGYSRIPSVIPTAPPGRGFTREQQLRRLAAETLAASGSTEVLAYPFVSAASNATFGSPDDTVAPAVELANPLDAEAPLLRTTLLPGLIDVARRNLSRGLTDLSLYEIGAVFQPVPDASYGVGEVPPGATLPTAETLADLDASIPPQPWHVAMLLLGNAVDKQPGQAAVPFGVADALDAVRLLASALDVPLTVRQGSHTALHPGRTAEVLVPVGTGVDVVSVGYVGELLPALAAELDLPRVVAVAELDLSALIELAARSVQATPLAGYPAATQDVSLVVPASVAAGDVLDAIAAGAGVLLESIHLVDDYRGAGIDVGQKSLTFALRFRATDRTLTAAEASEARIAGAAEAGRRFGAVPRD
ncbi:phenylalanine--tRNA ligase subunit beta [Subtercola boreus]|uniref:Phenylalanine--tRNA ligase beta subunit n=1 Tax=Subtercola boreus TaxID=120213 RepID=A0A3E0WCZ6_9MICO|nr:phenylalanine--tRNA ligase subunit beta [Subtercola boreus]RFA21853.1 phenylalanine--tRNA ligase subunit beta [Subtercola boreus]RFA21964.1 phenylalanine--tRNA ligase subunit beta [Subtercola boreus]RFA27912.1 phenylalanine--tRNA ligase subunit beta [Subtercola boreus]